MQSIHYEDENITVRSSKPRVPEILKECYCVARKKQIGRGKTKSQTAAVVSLWF